jgi:signal transduction histidine kinase/CheY-like chemotaxis protein/HAMP domain-containing protein
MPMHLKNITIKTRLLLGFFIIIFMVLILGWLAYSQSRSIWQNASDMYLHPYKVNIAVREVEVNIAKMHRSLKDVVLSEGQSEIDNYKRKINANEVLVYENFEIIYSQYLGKKSTIDSAYNAFKSWKEVRDTTIILREQGKIKEAAFRTTHEAETYIDKVLMTSVNVLKNFAMNKAETLYSSAEKSKSDLQTQLLIVLSIIILLTIIITITILQGINNPVNELIAATIRHRAGDYSARSNNESTNEIGMLARSVNLMAENIQDEISIKTSVAELADAIIGKEELREFGKSVIEVLLSKTNSNIGAIYFLNENTLMFEPYFTVGLSSDKIRPFSAGSFEGEFGRALLEKKIVRITDIPEDSVFDFAVVSGNFKPREIINIPILLREKTIAVISLASLFHYTDKMMELLSLSVKNLTTGLNSILAFDQIREYSRKLAIQNSELETQSKELTMQADELLEQNAELDMQKRQIDEANRLKSEFLSSMSHELRTPLNSVIALTNVLHRRLQNQIPDEEYSYLEVIERNGKHLLTLINDILDLSRIEAGKADIELSKFSVKELADNILLTLQPQIANKGITAENKIGIDIPMITSDMSKCHHILQNLIGNAVKFTDTGSVEISAELSDGEVYISVKDTGIGIPDDQLPHIFEEFRQVDGTASRKHEGTGLGLAIADKYSRLLDSRIKVKSKLGEGSTFTFIVLVEPLAKFSTDSIEAAVNPRYTSLVSIPVHKPAGFSGNTILIIEDSEPAIIQLSEILKEQGYLIIVARSGPEALEIVKIHKPDAIILDLMMPGMDGFEVLEKIRAGKKIAKIPVLILTAKYLNKSEFRRLTQNNIHQLIQKGDINKTELLESIGRMFVMKVPEKNVAGKIIKRGSGNKSKSRILLIEDNPDNVLAVKALIGSRHEIFVATDGPEGVDKARELIPDLVLLDISLPLMDGFKVLDEIRKDVSLNNIPVIAVTASVMKGNREEMLNYGFDDYISKPVDSKIFDEKLIKYLGTS